MEHSLIQVWAQKNGVILSEDKERKLLRYAEMIHETNRKFNLTGHKSIDEIITNLIIGSLDPFISLHVPRGTVFADIGTGAGIPGIPLAVYCENWNGICIDSNNKKVSFVDSAIKDCLIDNLTVCYGRLENLAREQMRDAFEYVFSRALGELFFVIEVGAPLLKIGGMLYIYSNVTPEHLPEPVRMHSQQLGLSLLEHAGYGNYGIRENGLVFLKTKETNKRYPRNMTAIRRDIEKKIKVLPSR